MAIVVKATLHSGKGNRKHNDHDFMPYDRRNVKTKTFAYTGNIKSNPDDYLSGFDIQAELEKMAKEEQLTNKCAIDELTLYYDLFGETWHKQNQKNIREGHKNRCKTMEEWSSSKNYSPVEDILQIGNVDTEKQVPVEVLEKSVKELMEWEEKTLGKNLQHVSIALHLDEATPHYHKRDVYVYWDNEGLSHPCVKDALEQAGIPLPDPSKPESKKNNRKAMYDQMRREAFCDIIEKYLPKDFVLDRTPDPKRRKHMSVDNYKDFAKNQKDKQEIENQKTDLVFMQSNLNTVKTLLEADRKTLEIERQNYKAKVEKELKTAYTALEQDLRSAYNQRMSDLDDLIKDVSDYKLQRRADRLRKQSMPSLQTNNNDYQFD